MSSTRRTPSGAAADLEAAEAVARALALEKRLRDHHAQPAAVAEVAVGGGVEHEHGKVLLAAAVPRVVAGEGEQPVALPVRLGRLSVIARQIVPSDPRRISDDEVETRRRWPRIENGIASVHGHFDEFFRRDQVRDSQQIVRPCRGDGQRMEVEAGHRRVGWDKLVCNGAGPPNFSFARALWWAGARCAILSHPYSPACKAASRNVPDRKSDRAAARRTGRNSRPGRATCSASQPGV